jgi:hypothetical protein
VRETMIQKRDAQRRKMAALVREMTKEEAEAFISKDHDYRREWMIAHLDGQWGQTIAGMMKRLVSAKLGLFRDRAAGGKA